MDELHKAIVSEDWCPKCLGELNTGWECIDCGFDARPLVPGLPPEPDWKEGN